MSSSGTIGNRVADKVTVVTGASSGVGRAIALAFAAQGAKLVLCADLRPDPRGGFGAVEATTPTHELICQKYGEDKAVFLKTDVTVGTQVDATVQEAVRLGGRLDVMINNAGTGGTESAGKVHEMSDESWDFVMNINTRSVFLGCRAACAQFLKQDLHPSGDRGWIINTASMLGLVGLKPGAAAYCASKGAVVLLTKQVAVEYGSDRIHCNALCPGYLKTPMTQPIFADDKTRETIIAATPWGEWGNAEDVAKCAVFLASDDAAYVTGLPMVIDGGYTAQ
ncbi:MAG: putative secondary metabolism biosynthetic enzyme [Piccolia ochrophora]|nr:MAG: putative secondary metabolism biosynthetic enzyme [Piccolia ochrophora]